MYSLRFGIRLRIKKEANKMNKPKLNVVRLNCADVIATSGLYQLSGMGDTVKGNLQFKTPSGSLLNSTQFGTQYGSSIFYINSQAYEVPGSYFVTIDSNGSDPTPIVIDGYYQWDSGKNQFRWVSGPDT